MSTTSLPTHRPISHSEVSTLNDCQAKHDFRYVGQLAGTALASKTTIPLLRDGRAWGQAVAHWHAHHTEPTVLADCSTLIDTVLEDDADQQRELGVYDPDEHDKTRALLLGLLSHYTRTTTPLPIDRLEHPLLVPIPSRTGTRNSNRYVLEAYVDGIHIDGDGRTWIVEYKLRKQLMPYQQIVLSRQIRWYAWAYWRQTGQQVAGIIVDERLKAVPGLVKINQNGTPSKVQTCEPELYEAACQEADKPVDLDVLAGLRSKVWQHRHPVILRDGELSEVGAELVSAARQVQQFDTGLLYPIRNPSRARCPGCQFKDICATPMDRELVDAMFDRKPAKHARPLEAAA